MRDGNGEDERDLDQLVVDVTIPVQALVQDSKLFIPGGRAKVRLDFLFPRPLAGLYMALAPIDILSMRIVQSIGFLGE